MQKKEQGKAAPETPVPPPQKRTNAVEIIRVDPESRSAGFFYMNADGTLSVKGFGDLPGQEVRVSELDGAVILACDEEIPREECIRFDELFLRNRNAIKYFTDRGAIGKLFVKVFGLYVECPDVSVLNYLTVKK